MNPLFLPSAPLSVCLYVCLKFGIAHLPLLHLSNLLPGGAAASDDQVASVLTVPRVVESFFKSHGTHKVMPTGGHPNISCHIMPHQAVVGV